jgi:alanine racemase
MVDVTDTPDVKVGDEVVVLGEQDGQMISTFEHAELCDTLPYNVLCALQANIPRVVVD